MSEKEEFSSLVRVKDFVEKRAAQIADLLKVVDNARLVSGEVTKGPRTAAQRLPRHMRRRAMAYEIRRFPKGLRKFASSFLISNHRKKPPCRFFRRRTRNLLLNYIRRQKKAVWLETHIWHAKRFHMVERWGYRLPDRCYQRNFRPIYRNSMRHCTVRDKSYLNCFLITGPSQEVLLEKLKAFCAVTVSPTFAFKSALGGLYEMSTLLYRPGFYPQGLLGPARFQWSRNGSKISLAIWIHPTSRDDLLPLLISALSLKKEPKHGENEKEELTEIPKTYEDWKLRSCQILTDVYSSTDGQVTMEDLKDQLVRFRFYGPKSLDVVRAAVQLSSQSTYEESHTVWRKLARIDEVPDSRVFSLLVEDPRVSKLRAPKVPAGKEEEEMGQVSCPVADFWSREKRIEALKNRLTDQEMNRLKGRPVGGATETPAKIPILVIIRHQGTGKQESLDGVEVIAPTGFGRDLWVSAQMQTAHASGLRDDGAAHHEAGCLAFPADYLDTDAGSRESTRVREELELKHEKRPHNRRVRHWKKLSVKFPYSFEFPQLVSNWTGGEETKQTYVLRDRRALLAIDDWIKDKGKKPEAILSEHKTAMIAVQLCCLARGRPKRFALISLPKTEDLVKIRECQYQGKPFLLREVDKNGVEESSEMSNGIENLEMEKKEDKREWKDIVSLDPSTREKQISLKPLFSSCKNVDKAAKRKILNRKKKEAKKRRVEVQKERLAERNQEEEEKNRASYRHSASRETVGRVLRGDYSFTAAKGTALAMVPVSSLPKIVEMGRILFLRNITSKYYHPAKVTLLRQAIEL